MPGIAHKTLTMLISASLAAATVGPLQAAEPVSRADYEDCQARDETAFRAAIAAISHQALKAGVAKVDYPALVAEQWRKSSLDEVIDKRVDLAIEEVKSETSWSELLQSLANSETSQKLATTVAERVYRSDAVKSGIEGLAGGVAKDVAKTIELASQDTATPILACLKAFVGPRYGSAIALAVAGDASKDIALDPAKGGAEVSTGAVLKESGGGIAGATILIVRRQLATIATRVGQRIVGSVLSRLVSVAAGGIGLVLIAKDIWEFRNGVLPIIATEMKAKSTKDKVQEELATTLHDQIGEHVKDIADASADRVMEIWAGFKRAHALVLKLAEGNGEFRTFLDGVKPDALPRLDEIVGLLVPAEGEVGVMHRLADGSLNEAVHLMSDQGLQIARETQSVATGLAWTKVAGTNIGLVTEYEIHKRAKPDDFTNASLARIFALDDRAAITRLVTVPRDARDTLFEVSSADLKGLAKNLSDVELTTLASYLKGLGPGPREKVLRSVADAPSRMQVLASSRVRDAIIASADQTAAVTMMLERSTSFSPKAFWADIERTAQGRVSPWLVLDKYPAGVALMALLGLAVLAWLKRLTRRRGTPNITGQSV